ncbi:MAG: Ppx/GppA family phosphatase [Azospirillaceae bacterium]|nr:Ppx/GppA family phosphatase [Azospirillaceae bacterium]
MPLFPDRPEDRSHSATPERVAVIDIGSNSIRLVVFDALGRSPMPLFNEKILCGLGRTVERTGRLNPEGVTTALENLSRFALLARAMQVARIEVLATAAVRDASDGADFVALVARQTGLSVRVIQGEEEARLSALGVLSGSPDALGLMGDLGGGSLELVNLTRGAIGEQVTLPLGPLRLMDMGVPRPAGLVKAVDDHLASLPWLGGMTGRTFYPVGGNWRAIARLHMEHFKHPLHIIHSYTVNVDDATMQFMGGLAGLNRLPKAAVPLLAARRRGDTLPFAALVMERLLRMVRPSRIVFTAYGLREGLLFDLLTPSEQAQDPLLAYCAGVAVRLGRFGQGEIIAGWTAPLFVGEDQAALRLRQAACLLSDLGWAEHPDYRAEHVFLRVLRMPFVGLDHSERAFLALVGYARYEGRIDALDPLQDRTLADARALMSESQLRRALVLGLALRLAHSLTGGVATLLQRTQLRLEDERLVLTLAGDAGVLAGDVVERRLSVLARLLNRAGTVALE